MSQSTESTRTRAVNMNTPKKRVFTCYITGENRHEKLTEMEEHVQWYIGQDEIGRMGMEHIQLTFGFKNARSLAAVQKLFQNQNIQIAEDPEKCIKYCTDESKRDGELYSFGDMPNFARKINKTLIDDALTKPNYEEAMKFIEDADKLFYLQNQKKLCLYFTQKYDTSDKALYPPETFNIPLKQTKDKVIVLIGPTGMGKTQYALAHFKKPLHVKDKEDWRRYNDSIDGIVLDDLDFPSWSPLTFLKLLDMETPITQNIKYGATRIKAGTPRIICVNHTDLLWPRQIHIETQRACERRMEIHLITEQLYNETRNEEMSQESRPQTPPQPIPSTSARTPPTPMKKETKKRINTCKLCDEPAEDTICTQCFTEIDNDITNMSVDSE